MQTALAHSSSISWSHKSITDAKQTKSLAAAAVLMQVLQQFMKEPSENAKSGTNPHYLIPREAGNAPVESYEKSKWNASVHFEWKTLLFASELETPDNGGVARNKQ